MSQTADTYTPPELCRHGWHDGIEGHVCYQPEGHEPPCKCNYCGAVEGEKPKQGTAGGRPLEGNYQP